MAEKVRLTKDIPARARDFFEMPLTDEDQAEVKDIIKKGNDGRFAEIQIRHRKWEFAAQAGEGLNDPRPPLMKKGDVVTVTYEFGMKLPGPSSTTGKEQWEILEVENLQGVRAIIRREFTEPVKME